jgi:FkbM family methyltransferase
MLVELLPKPLRRLARRYIEQRGFIPVADAPTNLHTVMDRRKDIVVEAVLDVGASNGRWSEAMMKHLPDAKYLLVEAQEAAHGTALGKFKAAHSKVQYELCAAGDYDGEAHFDASTPLGGVAGRKPFAKNDIIVAMKTLDGLVQRHNLRGPYLLKLDTHGFEVPILEGARAVLTEASILIIEGYNFTLRPGAFRFYELCAYLDTRGFRCADMFDLMMRPTDNVLWQMDMVFLPSTHAAFRLNNYGLNEREL